MATFKCNFDSKKFMKELERDIKKSVDLGGRRHIKKILNDHVGETISATCSSCGNVKVVVLRGGGVRCPKCGHTAKVNLVPDWR